MLYAFLLAFGVSYLGSLPPGMLNLTIIDLTRARHFGRGLSFAVACALVELVQGFIALRFSNYLQANAYIGCAIQLVVIPIFVALGLYFWRRNDWQMQRDEASMNQNAFWKGIGLSVANPLAIPFWLFWGMYFAQRGWLTLDEPYITTFAVGLAVGTLAMLMTYAAFSRFILSRISLLNKWINEIIALTLFFLAASQLWNVIRHEVWSCAFG